MDSKDAAALLDTTGDAPSLHPVLGANLTPPAATAAQVLAPPPQSDSGFPGTPQQEGEKNIQALRKNYVDVNKEGDIPLDIDSGVDPWTRTLMGFHREKQNKVDYLEKKYGKGSVRLSTDGVPIVRVQSTETGKPKDIRATELGMSASDLLDLIGQTPEIVAGILATRGGGKAVPGMGKRLMELGKMAAATEGAGALKDVAVRASDNQAIDPSEIADTRAKMAVGDVAVGGALAAAGKLGSKLITPNFQENDAVTKQFREAVDYFKNKGFNLPMTPGESSGLPILQRSEAILRQLPGSSGPLKDVVDKQNSELQKIQKVAMGLKPDATPADIAKIPTQEATGDAAIKAIGDKVSKLKSGVKAAGEDLEQTGQAEIGKTLDSAAPGGPIDVPALGGQLRTAAVNRRNEFLAKSAEDYGKVYAHPLANEYNLPATGLAGKAKALLAKLPAPETISEQPTGIVDKFGNEILRDEAGHKIMRNFVPSNVLTKLNDLAALGDGKFRLSDLIKMRTDVSNEIAQGEAVPGVDTHYLNNIRSMLTETIEDGLGKLKDPNLKTLWKTANDNYAKGIKPFQQSGIQELFKESGQGGFVGDNQIVNRAMSSGGGEDIFNAYKHFYGPTSKEFGNLKRAILEKVTGKSENPFTDTIDADSFIKNLAGLANNSPGVAREVFGPKSGQLMRTAKALSAGSSGEMQYARLSGKIDAAEFQKMLASGDVTAQKLQALIDKEKGLADAYKTDLLKKIGTGSFESENIEPAKFVRYLSTQASPQDVQKVMSLIHDSPQVLQDIKTKTVQDILDRAYPEAKAVDNPSLISGEPRVLTQGGLQNALGDATQRERYRSILGADTYTDLEQLTKFLAPRARGEQAFSTAGGLSAGMQVAGLLRTGDIKYLYNAGKNWLLATAYTTPAVRKWMANQVVTPENSAKTLRYLISSAPVVEAAYRDFGAKGAQDFMAQVNASIDKNQKDSKTGNPVDEDTKRQQYRSMLQSP